MRCAPCAADKRMRGTAEADKNTHSLDGRLSVSNRSRFMSRNGYCYAFTGASNRQAVIRGEDTAH
eukprot:2865350-Prymnesium_polylepis.1